NLKRDIKHIFITLKLVGYLAIKYNQ
ncbi:MAG: hypothetical protein Q609_ECAC02178G0001, partial [Escherichia coli DORA_A_5_14_21]